MSDNESGVARKRGLPDLRILTMVFILAGLWIFFRLQVGEFYFSGESAAKLSRDMATWTILAAGMTLVIVSGNIDLSVGSLMALVVGVCALLLDAEHGFGWPAEAAVAVALLAGLLLGMFQGALVAYFRIPAFIVTLAGLFVFRGLTQKVSARDPRVPDEAWVNALGFNYLPPALGWALGAAVSVAAVALVVLAWRRRKSLGIPTGGPLMLGAKAVAVPALVLGFIFLVNQYKGVPAQTLVMAAAMLAMYVAAHKSAFGRRVFAVGGNPEAARLSGINIELTTVAVFALMGLLAGVAGVVWMAQNQGATQKAGTWYELYAIAACVIGGTSLMGGRGSVFGAFLGALVMATVIQGMDYTGLPNWLQLVVRGSVLAAAVGIDIAAKDPPPWMTKVAASIKGAMAPGTREEDG